MSVRTSAANAQDLSDRPVEYGGLRVAIVHDWLVTYAGAERVLEQMLLEFPEADLFSLVDFLQDEERHFVQDRRAHTTFIQRLPFARRKFRAYFPLMSLAIEQLDLREYDLVLSSSYAFAKGVLTRPNQLHVCMCYSPIRYAWDLQQQYLNETGLDHGIKGAMARTILHKTRIWDAMTANGVDHFIAISRYVQRRIKRVYRRKATVIYPPVDTSAFQSLAGREEFYLTASRLVPYKRVDLIVESFSLTPERELVVIGNGPEYDRIRKKAGPNVRLLGWQPFEVLLRHMQRTRAFLFASEEDFGIVPLEAQACGTPVIAFHGGAAPETIRGLEADRPTGVFFARQTVEDLLGAVERFEREGHVIDPEDCRTNALRFSVERFRGEFRSFMVQRIRQYRISLTERN